VIIPIEKIKRQRSPHTDHISKELTQAGGNILRYEIYELIYCLLNTENCHSNESNLLLKLFMRRVIKLTVVIIGGYHCYYLHTKSYLSVSISTKETKYESDILHSTAAGEKMEV
jgi:hypothetical protein